ncbi:MAG TPA: Fur family transcriptional regulator [Ruminiclostridium sp.]|nr:Fur family transcriptional regulator [Ruminiclostridium sp.]
MVRDVSCYREILASKGIKGTRQRLAVIGELYSSSAPLTADEIYIKIHDDGSENLSLSTVYRILDMFVKKEIVVKNGLLEGGKALYEIVSGMHRHNLICIKCHRMMSFGGCPLENFEKNLEDTTGFHISGHKMEIYGICPECSRSKS